MQECTVSPAAEGADALPNAHVNIINRISVGEYAEILRLVGGSQTDILKGPGPGWSGPGGVVGYRRASPENAPMKVSRFVSLGAVAVVALGVTTSANAQRAARAPASGLTAPYTQPATAAAAPYTQPGAAPTAPYAQPPTAPSAPYTQPPTAPTAPYTQPPTAPTAPYTQPPAAPTAPYTQPPTAPTDPYTHPATVPTVAPPPAGPTKAMPTPVAPSKAMPVPQAPSKVAPSA
jgi:hypothetical protein